MTGLPERMHNGLPDESGVVGVRFITESGLLWKLNSEVLWPLGLALCVAPLDDNMDGAGPVQLALLPAPDGVWTIPPEREMDRRAQLLQFVKDAPMLREGLLLKVHNE